MVQIMEQLVITSEHVSMRVLLENVDEQSSLENPAEINYYHCLAEDCGFCLPHPSVRPSLCPSVCLSVRLSVFFCLNVSPDSDLMKIGVSFCKAKTTSELGVLGVFHREFPRVYLKLRCWRIGRPRL